MLAAQSARSKATRNKRFMVFFFVQKVHLPVVRGHRGWDERYPKSKLLQLLHCLSLYIQLSKNCPNPIQNNRLVSKLLEIPILMIA